MNPSTITNNPNISSGAVDRMVDWQSIFSAFAGMGAEVSLFAGKPSQDPVRWLAEFERKSRHLPNLARVENVMYFLEETPYFWYLDEVKGKVLDFAEFKKLFLGKFVRKTERERALAKIKNMQFSSELTSVSSFAIDFKHFFALAYPKADKSQIILELFERFPPEFRGKFLGMKDIKDVVEISNFVELGERVEKMIR